MTQTTKRNEKSNAENDPTCIVPTVTKECQQGAMVGANTVTTLANQPLTEPNGKQRNSAPVTPTNTKRHKQRNATVKNCEQCGAAFETTRRKVARYCNAICRRNAWLDRNPERAAQIAIAEKARLKEWYIANGKEWVDQ